MANEEHLIVINKGSSEWNAWREQYPDIQPNLSGAYLGSINLQKANLSGANFRDAVLYESDLWGTDLSGADLAETDLSATNFSHAKLIGANLTNAFIQNAYFMNADLRSANLRRSNLNASSFMNADLTNADLTNAHLWNTDLKQAILRGANLTNAQLVGADLHEADLAAADLTTADLSRATLVRTNLTNAIMKESRIYGISAWDVKLDDAEQINLIITAAGQSIITVDNLKIAQFIYLLLNNAEIREVIDTITSKVALILGRFTPERKIILNAIRNEIRKRNYIPVLFDFDKPTSRDITETVSILAHMARFIIADLTDAKSIPQELKTIVPNLPSVPIQPLLLNTQREYGMFEHFRRFPWVLPIYRYENQEDLLTNLKEHIIEPAEQKANKLAQR